MLYFKIIRDNIVDSVEQHECPTYVYSQPNGMMAICPAFKAQCIISCDGNSLYQLPDRGKVDLACGVAVEITMDEYYYFKSTLDVAQDEMIPEIEEDDQQGGAVLSISEMRKRILSLEEQLAATKILLGVE